jgi:hypothetical protein
MPDSNNNPSTRLNQYYGTLVLEVLLVACDETQATGPMCHEDEATRSDIEKNVYFANHALTIRWGLLNVGICLPFDVAPFRPGFPRPFGFCRNDSWAPAPFSLISVFLLLSLCLIPSHILS